MRIRYIYSATVVIETQDCKVVCDGWWTPAYEGSWQQYPPWAKSLDEAVDILGEAQFWYISHTHPDHFDMPLLHAYLAKYPQTRVLIAKQTPPLLERKLRGRGIEPLVGQQVVGRTYLTPIPNRANSFNIDSALVVRRGNLSVANLNDNPFDQAQVEEIMARCGDHATVALLPFVGAGPWPQCYEMSDEDRLQAAEAKKQKGLKLFTQYCVALQPKVAVGFAGQYALHRENLDLNPLRGMADAIECRKLWSCVWVPADGGQSVLDVESGAWNSERTDAYDWSTMRNELLNQPTMEYRFEQELHIPLARLPLLKLLESAAVRARASVKAKRPLWLCFRPTGQDVFLCLNIADKMPPVERKTVDDLLPRWELSLDGRLLFGSLVRLYNFNSTRIGSLMHYRNVPNIFDKELDDLGGEFIDALRV